MSRYNCSSSDTQGTLDLSRPFCEGPASRSTDLWLLIVALNDLYFEPDLQSHKLQLNITGMAQHEMCLLSNGRVMLLNQPCEEPDLWLLICCITLCTAAVACHTDPALMARLGPETTCKHIVWHPCILSSYNRLIRFRLEKQGAFAALTMTSISTFLGVLEAMLIMTLSTPASAETHSFGLCAPLLPASCPILCRSRLYEQI